MDLKEKLTHFARTRYNMGQTKFEDYCGISRGVISSITKGTNTTTIIKIAQKCPEISLYWLLMDEGEMIRKDVAETTEMTEKQPSLPIFNEGKPMQFEERLALHREIENANKTIDRLLKIIENMQNPLSAESLKQA